MVKYTVISYHKTSEEIKRIIETEPNKNRKSYQKNQLNTGWKNILKTNLQGSYMKERKILSIIICTQEDDVPFSSVYESLYSAGQAL